MRTLERRNGANRGTRTFQRIGREPMRRDAPYEEKQEMLNLYGLQTAARTPVKVLATSDIHGELFGLQSDIIAHNPDIVAFAGDIADHLNQEEFMAKRLFALVRSFPHTAFVAIPGNHDFYAVRCQNRRIYGEADALGTPDNFHLLIDEGIEVKGLRLYGTPWVNYINGGWCYELDELDEGDAHFDAIPDGLDILLTHTPPLIRNSSVDVSTQRPNGSPHFGNRALTRAIETKRPRLTLCGHIHTGDHQPFEVTAGAWCANVSRVNEQYRVAYAPLVAVL